MAGDPGGPSPPDPAPVRATAAAPAGAAPVPADPFPVRRLLGAFTVPGLACGVALERLFRALDGAPAGDLGGFLALIGLCATVAGAAVYVVATEPGHRRGAAGLAAGSALVAGGLFAWSLLTASGGAIATDDAFAAGTVGVALFTGLFVATPFLRAWRERSRAARRGAPARPWYEALHELAWEQACAGLVGAAFSGAVLLLVLLAAALFDVVGVDLGELVLVPEVLLPVGAAAAATGAGAVRVRPGLLATTRDLLLALVRLPIAIHLPIVLGLLAAIAVRGLDPIDRNDSPTALLLAAAGIALAIRSAFAVPGRPRGTGSVAAGIATRLLAASVLPLVLIAAHALRLRVEAEGWTHLRVVAGAMVAVGTVYGAGYLAVALAPRPEPVLARANVAAALLVCAVAALLLTPALDGHTIGARSQLARAAADRARADFAYLAYESGAPGRAALAELAASDAAPPPETLAALARSSSRYGYERELRERAGTDRPRWWDALAAPTGTAAPATATAAAAEGAGALRASAREGERLLRAGPDAGVPDSLRRALDWWFDAEDGLSPSRCVGQGARCALLVTDASVLPGAARVGLLAIAPEGGRTVGLSWGHVSAHGFGWSELGAGAGRRALHEMTAPPAEIDALLRSLDGGRLPLTAREVPVLVLGDALLVPGRDPELDLAPVRPGEETR